MTTCLDRKAAAAALNVSRWTLDQYIADGRLPVVKLPSSRHPGEMSRRVLISSDDLKAFIERHRSGVVA
jgi:predicted site-specific integrase-resolvase